MTKKIAELKRPLIVELKSPLIVELMFLIVELITAWKMSAKSLSTDFPFTAWKISGQFW